MKEEVWIDINVDGELDLAPPSARTEIEGIEDPPKAPPSTVTPPAPYVVSKDHVAEVRRLQVTRKGIQEKLHGYHDDVLRAAIAAEVAAADSRPMFVSMLEAELKRRHETIH